MGVSGINKNKILNKVSFLIAQYNEIQGYLIHLSGEKDILISPKFKFYLINETIDDYQDIIDIKDYIDYLKSFEKISLYMRNFDSIINNKQIEKNVKFLSTKTEKKKKLYELNFNYIYGIKYPINFYIIQEQWFHKFLEIYESIHIDNPNFKDKYEKNSNLKKEDNSNVKNEQNPNLKNEQNPNLKNEQNPNLKNEQNPNLKNKQNLYIKKYEPNLYEGYIIDDYIILEFNKHEEDVNYLVCSIKEMKYNVDFIILKDNEIKIPKEHFLTKAVYFLYKKLYDNNEKNKKIPLNDGAENIGSVICFPQNDEILNNNEKLYYLNSEYYKFLSLINEIENNELSFISIDEIEKIIKSKANELLVYLVEKEQFDEILKYINYSHMKENDK